MFGEFERAVSVFEEHESVLLVRDWVALQVAQALLHIVEGLINALRNVVLDHVVLVIDQVPHEVLLLLHSVQTAAAIRLRVRQHTHCAFSSSY